MPFFSSLLKRFGEKRERQDHGGSRRRSQVFNILRKRSERTTSPSTHRPSDPEPVLTNKLVSIPDSNKPLPPPPKLGSEIEKPPKRTPIKLERIISPLSDDAISRLFSGAPQFFVRYDDSKAPLPSVEFPWDGEIATRHLHDRKQVQHDAWRCCSTYADRQPQENRFSPNIREKPNVLSLQGLEKGTFGFAAALEYQISDAFQEPSELDPEIDLVTIQAQIYNGYGWQEKQGVRPMNERGVIKRLSEIGEFYHQKEPQQPLNVQLYTELFTRTLFPPERVTDVDDPYSLTVQIEELLNILSCPAFIDFSIVEMRIRLGQILWAPSIDEDDDISMAGESEDGSVNEKSWLLLQILLSCELLIRLDLELKNTSDVIPAGVQLFNRRANSAIRWGILLARSWLDNIFVNIPEIEPKPEKKSSCFSLTKGHEKDDSESSLINRITFESRIASLQLSGLLYFAHNIGWANIEALAYRCLNNKEEVSFSANTNSKSGTPISTMTRGSYFSVSRRPSLRCNASQQQRVYAVIHPSGWLSSSYLTGLVLPGESMSHLIISTLLENDGEAIGLLGEETTLYGGFIYAGKSYWSLFCIVGRVLAAGDDAPECMGWVSSSIVPHGLSERWVDIEVQEVTSTNSEARIWAGEAIEKDSNVIGDGDMLSTFSSDFILPQDLKQYSVRLDVGLPSLLLSSRAESTLTTTPIISTPDAFDQMPSIENYHARMIFEINSTGTSRTNSEDIKNAREERDYFTITIFLIHDVHFVTAYPCVAQNDIYSILSANLSSPALSGKPDTICHPLHKSYTYSHQPLLSVIQNQLKGEYELDPDIVLIIDCTNQVLPKILHVGHLVEGTRSKIDGNPQANLEILARAYCSENGFNALVSRKGRSCLSCSIREAKALAFRVVIRVDGNEL